MKKFYTILKLSPNAATQDSVALGIIYFDGLNIKHYLSERKLKVAKRLISDKNIDFDFVLHQVFDNLKNEDHNKNEAKLFSDFNDFTNTSFYSYLNRYANGLIQFSEPKHLLVDDSNDYFDKLVYALFHETITDEVKTIDDSSKKLATIIREKLLNKVENKIHVNYKFNPKQFPSIYFNYEMDCIGLNGSLIGAKSLQFNKTFETLDKNIAHYFILLSSLSNQYNKSLKDNNFYLISEEPEVIDSREHKLWESVKKNELISVIHPEESDLVAEQVMQKKASKFLDVQN